MKYDQGTSKTSRRRFLYRAGALTLTRASNALSQPLAIGSTGQMDHGGHRGPLPGTKFLESGEKIVGGLLDHAYLRGVEDVHLEDSLALMPCRAGHSIAVCDIHDPRSPRFIGEFRSPDLYEATGLTIHQGIGVVSSFQSALTRPRLIVLDVNTPTRMRQLASVEVGGMGAIYKNACHNGTCFVAHYSDRHLYAVDIQTPTKPRVIGGVRISSTDDGPFSVLIRWPYALVGTFAGKQSRLSTVDIGYPSQMKVINELAADPDFCTFSGTVKDGIYYVCSYSHSGIFAIDIRYSRGPVVVGKLLDKRINGPNRCVVAENRGYLPLAGSDGVAIVDITDPTKMRFLKALYDRSLMCRAYGITLRKGYLYVGARDSDCLTILDTATIEEVDNSSYLK